MARTTIEGLIHTAFTLSQVAPKEWEEFLKALEAYSVETNRRLLSSEPALLHSAQGQAIQIDFMLQTLGKARLSTQKAETRRNARPSNERKSWPSS